MFSSTSLEVSQTPCRGTQEWTWITEDDHITYIYKHVHNDIEDTEYVWIFMLQQTKYAQWRFLDANCMIHCSSRPIIHEFCSLASSVRFAGASLNPRPGWFCLELRTSYLWPQRFYMILCLRHSFIFTRFHWHFTLACVHGVLHCSIDLVLPHIAIKSINPCGIPKSFELQTLTWKLHIWVGIVGIFELETVAGTLYLKLFAWKRLLGILSLWNPSNGFS